jgi:hypothetical protein
MDVFLFAFDSLLFCFDFFNKKDNVYELLFFSVLLSYLGYSGIRVILFCVCYHQRRNMYNNSLQS